MLYISRCLRGNPAKYGVVDTDDCTETVITASELGRMVQDYNLDIKGVRCETRRVNVNGRRVPYTRVVEVKPYRGKERLMEDRIVK